MKDFAARHGLPTAAYARFTDATAAKTYIRERGAPIVVKTDGLAGGKGVTVAATTEEALAAVDAAMLDRRFGAAGAELVIEEFLDGEEASFFALCDGTTAIPFGRRRTTSASATAIPVPTPAAWRLCAGAVPLARARTRRDGSHHPADRRRHGAGGTPYKGVLYAGLMLTRDGPSSSSSTSASAIPSARCRCSASRATCCRRSSRRATASCRISTCAGMTRRRCAS